MSKSNIIAFFGGACAGMLITWLSLKKHFEQIAQEEIDSVKSMLLDKKSRHTDTKDKAPSDVQAKELKSPLVDYAAILKEEGYTNYSEHSKKIKVENDDEKKPFVISPDQYGEHDEYDQISLTYYSDGILADDCNEIVDDPCDSIGNGFVEHFGEYEDDAVYIRNDRLKCDYEILKDNRSFESATGIFPDSEE